MIGTVGARMLRLTAHHADAWNAWMDDIGNRPDGVAPLREAVDAARTEVGRDPKTLERSAAVLVEVAPQANTEWWGRWGVTPLAGPPEELAEELRAFGREGISHLQVMLLPNTPAGIAAFAPSWSCWIAPRLRDGGERLKTRCREVSTIPLEGGADAARPSARRGQPKRHSVSWIHFDGARSKSTRRHHGLRNGSRLGDGLVNAHPAARLPRGS